MTTEQPGGAKRRVTPEERAGFSAFVKAGFQAIGYDIDERKVEALKAGQSYIKHISHETIQEWNALEQVEPTADMRRLQEAGFARVVLKPQAFGVAAYK